MPQPTLAIKHGHLKPGIVIRVEAGRPDDALDCAAGEVEVSAGEAGTCFGSKRSGSATFAATPLIWAQSSSLEQSGQL